MKINKLGTTCLLTGLVGLLLGNPVYAIERSQIWVNPINQTSSVAWYDSSRADTLSQSIITPWLQQEPSGELLSEWRSDTTTALLQIPIGVDRFTQGTLEISGVDKAHAFLNGKPLTPGASIDLTLQTGDHQLLVLAGGVENWSDVELKWQGQAEHDQLNAERPARYRLNAEQLFDAETTTALVVSPDGEHVVWRRQWFSHATGDSPQQRVQVYNLASRAVVFEWNDTSVGQFSWHPASDVLAFVQDNHIQTLHLGSGEIQRQSTKLERLGGLRWLTDDTLLFTLSERDDEHDGQVKRYRALEDRWNYFRQRTDLFTLRLNDGLLSQVTSLDDRVNLQDVSGAGDYVLVTQSVVDYAEPPHSLTRLMHIEVASGEQQTVGEYRTFNQARYAEDGLYVVAGPEFADHAGRRVSDDSLLSNNYDGQLYQVSLDGATVRPLSADFDPAISGIEVLGNGDLLVRTTDRDRAKLYQYSVTDARFSALNQVIEMVDVMSVSRGTTPRVVYAGTSATAPQRTYMQDLNDSAQLLWDSADDYYRLNSIADTREWNFTNQRGDTIYGRIYLPHNFDASQQYPALVYYYGGTTPVSRNFTGRYPFNLWADMGYVVYVLQPTGAIGFGQDFSARHVNAWGEYTVDDIIEGTQRFINEHDFVDADRVGNLGASYGGFMTMLLATNTDLFAASMSHAGISHISSYWGHGWWGFGYSGEASKGSFPWNAPELYRERSPLNFADQINHPLLLIHGDSDTNVPPGESHMMYTALKLLGKEVELVEFVGEDHAINRRTPRLLWWETYMAFFDMHLKDQPQWWEHLYAEH